MQIQQVLDFLGQTHYIHEHTLYGGIPVFPHLKHLEHLVFVYCDFYFYFLYLFLDLLSQYLTFIKNMDCNS